MVIWGPQTEASATLEKSLAMLRSDYNDHADDDNNPHKVTDVQAGAAPLTHKHSAADVTSGILPVANGGTGSSTASGALTNLGAVPTSRTVNGRALSGNISLTYSDVGAASSSHSHSYITYSTTDLTAGSSSLTTGKLYCVYE